MAHALEFTPLTAADAPLAVQSVLVGSARRFGFLPDAVARIAHAPAALRHLLAGFAAFEKSSLSDIDRELIAMSVAWEHECHYCMALHSAMLSGAADHAATVAALRAGTPLPDPRLEALRRYVRALLRGRGSVDDDTHAALVVAGYNAEQALEIVLGVGVYVLSTFLNIVTRSEPDAPFAAFDWSRPDGAPRGVPVLA